MRPDHDQPRGLAGPADRAVTAEPPETDRPAVTWAWRAVFLAHLLAVLWPFGGALVAGRLLHFHDLSTCDAPEYAFAAESLRRGVWPLWNPSSGAGGWRGPALPLFGTGMRVALVPVLRR